MIKKIFITLIFVLFASNAMSAGSDSTPKKVKSDYDKAVTIMLNLQKNMKKKAN